MLMGDNLIKVIKNNMVIFMSIGIFVTFFIGYTVGMNFDQNTSTLQQELKYLEQKIDDLENRDSFPTIKISKDDDPILGNPDAPISIIEFSDYQCPYCARFYFETLPLLEEQYIEKGIVNFIYRDFPIQNSHPNAMVAAIASECADDQGKFWEYHDMLFDQQSTWRSLETNLAISTFKQFALNLGLKQESFDSCLDSGKYFDEVNKDLADGRSNKISGTPAFFIGNDKLGYTSIFGAKSFSDFQSIIDKKLDP